METSQTYTTLLSTTTTFLTIFTHELLYLRNLYPLTSFLLTKAYNTPVHQNRHPRVCQWITDAMTAIHTQLSSGIVARICIVMYSPKNKPLERYVVDVSRFPVVAKSDRERVLIREPPSAQPPPPPPPTLPRTTSQDSGDGPATLSDHWTDPHSSPPDIAEQLRATLIRLATATARLKPLPSNCTFSIAIELKDEGDIDPPIGHPQPWIPVQPSEQVSGRRGEGGRGADVGGVRTTPVRSVEAGECIFEVWVEEGRGKFEVEVEDEKEGS